MIIVSTGCPASIGPEISLRASTLMQGVPRVLVGDEETLLQAADLCGIPQRSLKRFHPDEGVSGNGTYLYGVEPKLEAVDRIPGQPSSRSGEAQLAYVEVGYALSKRFKAPLVTAAVNKGAIAHCGLERAESFRGHTEWLQELDGAGHVTMCFYAPQFSSSLVTTHLPLRQVADALTPEGVERSIYHLAQMLIQAGILLPNIAVASLNPHAGEGEMFGDEERRALAPGIAAARELLRGKANVVGPVGAETAFRVAAKGEYHGVVAMYHDQATIPMKLAAFGEAVNVTMGLSIVRTSVDHGTAYDIAWQGKADHKAMLAAMHLAATMGEVLG